MRLNTCAFISTVVLSAYPTTRAQIGAMCAPLSSCVYTFYNNNSLKSQMNSNCSVLNCKPQYRVYQYTGTDTTLPTPQQSMPFKNISYNSITNELDVSSK